MRKFGYFISFLAVIASITLTIVSQAIPNWITYTSPKALPGRFTASYGLYERCDSSYIPLPGSNGGYASRTCTRFPSPTECDRLREAGEGQFCLLWHSAGYVSQLSVVFGVAGVVSIMAASLSRARRRSLWQVVVGLVGLRAASQIASMSLIVHLWRTWDYPAFEGSNLGSSFFVNLSSWVLDLLITFGVAITGFAADAGHSWAAGRRAYRPIPTNA